MTNHNLKRANQLAPTVERVYGGRHLELTRVREITQDLQRPDSGPRVSVLFNGLRNVTENYAISNDVCDAFEATCEALE